MSVAPQSSTKSRKVVICYDESTTGREDLEWINSHLVLLPEDELTIVTVINADLEKIEGIGSWATTTVGGVGGIQDYRHVVHLLEEQGRESLAKAVQAIHNLGVVSKCISNINANIINSVYSITSIPKYYGVTMQRIL